MEMNEIENLIAMCCDSTLTPALSLLKGEGEETVGVIGGCGEIGCAAASAAAG